MPERMNIACANKLLKIIEEPPKNTVILMVSDTPEQILGTILSRTQRLNVRPITAKALTEAIIQQYHIEPDAARQIAHLAHGNMLEAEKTLSTEQESDVFLEFFIRMMRNSWARNVKEMKNMAEELSTMTREKQKSFLNRQSICRRVISSGTVVCLSGLCARSALHCVPIAQMCTRRSTMSQRIPPIPALPICYRSHTPGCTRFLLITPF